MPIGSITSLLLNEMEQRGASDMYLTAHCKPSLRINQETVPIGDLPLKPVDIERMLSELLNEDKKKEFEETLDLNFSVIRDDGSRYRFNFFRQKELTGMVVRRVNMKVPTIEELELPEIYAKSIMKSRGLLIIASPGGSGKSTSMAAMIDHRNRYGKGHILTIEDPIEFIHRHGSCIITQREVGVDTYSYGMALKNALRQRADVIAIGEIRDKEGLEHALRFAETGHLCVATLHSNNSHQALMRMANLVHDDSRKYLLSTISQNLIGIFSQKIVKNLRNKYSVVCEVLLNEGLVKSLISDDRLLEIKEYMERNHNSDTQTFDQVLYKFYESGKISAETAIAEADNSSAMKLKISQTSRNYIGMEMDSIDKNVF